MSYFEKYQPGLSIDCVTFGFHDNELKVLLLKMRNMDRWALLGGFVEKEEHLDDTASRVLLERAGVSDIKLQQFKVFGNPGRYDETYVNRLLSMDVISNDLEEWFLQRFITIGYYALVEFSKVNPVPDELSVSCEWISINEIPEMIIDHQIILQEALNALRRDLRIKPIGKGLLEEKFTMTELRTLYETILGESLDRRNFQRKMLSFGIIEKLDEVRPGGAHKAPFLYRFNDEIYNQTVEKGFNTVW